MSAFGCSDCGFPGSKPPQGSIGSRVRICELCKAWYVRCAFCSTTTRTGDHVRAWRYFTLDAQQEPKVFPVDPVWYRQGWREERTWLCCTECFTESGEAALLRYLNERGAMRPEPTAVMVYRYGDKFERITVKE